MCLLVCIHSDNLATDHSVPIGNMESSNLSITTAVSYTGYNSTEGIGMLTVCLQ